MLGARFRLTLPEEEARVAPVVLIPREATAWPGKPPLGRRPAGPMMPSVAAAGGAAFGSSSWVTA